MMSSSLALFSCLIHNGNRVHNFHAPNKKNVFFNSFWWIGRDKFDSKNDLKRTKVYLVFFFDFQFSRACSFFTGSLCVVVESTTTCVSPMNIDIYCNIANIKSTYFLVLLFIKYLLFIFLFSAYFQLSLCPWESAFKAKGISPAFFLQQNTRAILDVTPYGVIRTTP